VRLAAELSLCMYVIRGGLKGIVEAVLACETSSTMYDCEERTLTHGVENLWLQTKILWKLGFVQRQEMQYHRRD